MKQGGHDEPNQDTSGSAIRRIQPVPSARAGRTRWVLPRARREHGDQLGNEYHKRGLRGGGREVWTTDRHSGGNELPLPVVSEMVSLRRLAIRQSKFPGRRGVRWLDESCPRICRREGRADLRRHLIGAGRQAEGQTHADEGLPLSGWSVHQRQGG